jgi:hypothetical protein
LLRKTGLHRGTNHPLQGLSGAFVRPSERPAGTEQKLNKAAAMYLRKFICSVFIFTIPFSLPLFFAGPPASDYADNKIDIFRCVNDVSEARDVKI